ncbi:MAG: hypothetical protein QM831_41405 [Kofleriaceae bacterium]
MLLTAEGKRNLARALRRGAIRENIKIAIVAGAGIGFAINGPFALAPVCWAIAGVLHLRRGYAIIQGLRGTPEAWPILDAQAPLPRAKPRDR